MQVEWESELKPFTIDPKIYLWVYMHYICEYVNKNVLRREVKRGRGWSIRSSKMRLSELEIWECCNRIKFTVYYWRRAAADKDVRGTQSSHKNINKFLLERMSVIKTSWHRTEWSKIAGWLGWYKTIRCGILTPAIYGLRCHLHIFNGLFVYLNVKCFLVGW